jgi:hypothetical protein
MFERAFCWRSGTGSGIAAVGSAVFAQQPPAARGQGPSGGPPLAGGTRGAPMEGQYIGLADGDQGNVIGNGIPDVFRFFSDSTRKQ